MAGKGKAPAATNAKAASKAAGASKSKALAAKKPSQSPVASDASDNGSGGSEEEEEEDDDDEEEDAEPLELELDNFGRPHGVQGLLDYEFRSIHRALRVPDDKSYLDLVADCEVAFTAREIENAEYSTGSTFFLPATMEPRCLLERLAKDVFEFHAKDVTEYDPARSGAEWWTLVLDAGAEANDDVSFHWDRDYGLEAEYRVNLHPHIGTVTYLSDVGGPTIVLDRVSPVQTGSDDYGAGKIMKGYLSRPMLGKHISFDGRLLHGAPGDLADMFANGQTPSEAVGSKRKSVPSVSRRVTFLVNVWLNHKPIESDPLPEEDLEKLVSKTNSNIRFEFESAEELQSPEEQIRPVNADDAVKEKGADAITQLDLTFIEASRHMSLKLPVPVSAIQAEAKKTPQVSSFEIVFPTNGETKAELIAGDEVEEDDESDEDEGDEDDEEDEDEEEEE
ncbi:hypothetical protein PINS_up015589 [Pythium insidiosum]|nr:hypothetical protein PINS_up015589 [Pythium insidiosum]